VTRAPLLALLVACVDPAAPDDCGPRPIRPEVGASHEIVDGVAVVTLSRTDWLRLDAFHRELVLWSECVAGVPPRSIP
jgi:hypothetical protein